jgi:nucleotide-binding universal stress UspA family protein
MVRVMNRAAPADGGIMAAEPTGLPSAGSPRILVATDFTPASREAVEYAAILARRWRARLYVANAVNFEPYAFSGSLAATQELYDHLAEEARLELEQLKLGEPLLDLHPTTLVVDGRAANAIGDVVRRFDIKLLVVGTHARTGFARLMSGSVAETLARELPAPVLIVGPLVGNAAHCGFQRVLVPATLDAGGHSLGSFWEELGFIVPSEVLVLNVVPPLPAASSDADEIRNRLLAELHRRFPSRPGVRSDYEVADGDVVQVILDRARSWKADLILVGAHPAGILLDHRWKGIVAEIMTAAPCPILAISGAGARSLKRGA